MVHQGSDVWLNSPPKDWKNNYKCQCFKAKDQRKHIE